MFNYTFLKTKENFAQTLSVTPELLQQLPFVIHIHILSYISFEVDFMLIDDNPDSIFSTLNLRHQDRSALYEKKEQYEMDSIFSKNIVPLFFGYPIQNLPQKEAYFIFRNLKFIFANEKNGASFYDCATFHFTFVKLLSQCETITISGYRILEGISILDQPTSTDLNEKEEQTYRISLFRKLYLNYIPLINKNVRHLHFIDFELSQNPKYLLWFIPFLVETTTSLTCLSLTGTKEVIKQYISILEARVSPSLRKLSINVKGNTLFEIELENLVSLQCNGKSSIETLELMGGLIFLSTSTTKELIQQCFPCLKKIITNSVYVRNVWFQHMQHGGEISIQIASPFF